MPCDLFNLCSLSGEWMASKKATHRFSRSLRLTKELCIIDMLWWLYRPSWRCWRLFADQFSLPPANLILRLSYLKRTKMDLSGTRKNKNVSSTAPYSDRLSSETAFCHLFFYFVISNRRERSRTFGRNDILQMYSWGTILDISSTLWF